LINADGKLRRLRAAARLPAYERRA